jgi:hypothetical protein
MYSRISVKTSSWASTSFKTPDSPMIPEIEQFIGPTEKVQTGKLLNFKTLPN